MTSVADRFRVVSQNFADVIDRVPGDAWSNPSPCEGWVARDVVRHLVTWIPSPGFLLGAFDIDTGPIPSVDENPAGAWATVSTAVQEALDDPARAEALGDCGPIGEKTFAGAVEMTVIADVLIHTWDLATAAGIDVALDEAEVARQSKGLDDVPAQVDEAMRGSGHYGPRVEVSEGADQLTRLLAFMGRSATV